MRSSHFWIRAIHPETPIRVCEEFDLVSEEIRLRLEPEDHRARVVLRARDQRLVECRDKPVAEVEELAELGRDVLIKLLAAISSTL
jgi:hypothetical protein